MPDPIAVMTATTLAARIRHRELSCREVMAATLDHIDRVNPAVNAIVALRPRAALLAQADAADATLASGAPTGPLHGLPHAVKDLAATTDIATTLGSPLFAGHMPAHDAIFVERLRAAGAILIGKTNTPEFGLGSQTYNSVYGTTRNAYDPAKTAGGSSGGAAVALALRMVPLADGSDFAGSLRNPAGWNNVFGFRPSAGRVPFGPSPELFLTSIGIEGPMARTVTDLALLLSVMAGPDPRAPQSLADSPDFTQPLGRDMAGVRVGWLGDLGGIPMAPGMLDLCRSGLERLTGTGVTIEPATLGVGRDTIWHSITTLRQALQAGRLGPLYHDPAKRAQMKPEAVWEIEQGLALSAVDLYQASVQRSAVYRAFLAAFTRFDFLALPTAQVFPFAADLPWPAEVGGVAMDSYHRWMEVVAGPSLAGLPTAAVPAGFGPGGLPSGIQLIGPPRADLATLQLAYAYEQVSQDVLAHLPPALSRA